MATPRPKERPIEKKPPGEKLAVLQRGTNSMADAAGQAEWTKQKWIWVADIEDGFVAANIIEDNEETVKARLLNGAVLELSKNDTYRMNPPKYDKVEDLADLAYLNEPAVLDNLRNRYQSDLIYTYSGLFCVVVNPYKRLPIYTPEIVNAYRNVRRNELPPHVYSVADTAYREMIQNRENQSILITGESGAGKTENTKRVIQYLATIAAGTGTGRGALEQQLLQCNPVLEAFGNAKTVKNDNSSRFGKFIRIEFDRSGYISGGNIVTYLLESSRAVSQGANERNYHIFYQLLKSATPEERAAFLLDDLENVSFISNADAAEVDTINDVEEFKNTCRAMEVLGITADERKAIFTILGGIMQWGQVKCQDDRSEQAQIVDDSKVAMVCRLLGLPQDDLTRAMLKPRIKVGRDFVTKAQRSDQVNAAIKAICKNIYQRLFQWVVHKINQALDTRRPPHSVIGILDIAGFEIFQKNSFEQLCINYTNEKLQQFFNNHMFVKEQEEYRKQGIEWTFIDFALDLQPCIDLLEKPMGVLSLLDDECLLMPRSSDVTYTDKLVALHDNKTPKFNRLKSKIKQDVPGFIIEHYAAPVEYSVDGWLIKNTDPLNDNITEVLSKSTDSLTRTLFKDFSQAERLVGRRTGSMRTVSQHYRDQLTSLLTTLRATSPHFIRCIIPNLEKKPGKISGPLVLGQLRCNGVLEGIRICRNGFPGRISFHQFRQRYELLAPGAVAQGFMDGRKACEKILEALQVPPTNYCIGSTKVFFRTGVLGQLEEAHDEQLSKLIRSFQAHCRGYLARKTFRRLTNHELALKIIQRNCRKYLVLRTWDWWKLFVRVQPLLKVAQEDHLRGELEDTAKKLSDSLERQEVLVKECEELGTERSDLKAELDKKQEELYSSASTIERLQSRLQQALKAVEDMEAQAEDDRSHVETLMASKIELEKEKESVLGQLQSIQSSVAKHQEEKGALEDRLRATQGQLDVDQDSNQKLTKEKANLEAQLTTTLSTLADTEDRLKALQRAKVKVDGLLEEAEAKLQGLEGDRAEQLNQKRRLETELMAANERAELLENRVNELTEDLKNKSAELDQATASLEKEQEATATAERARRDLASQLEIFKEDLEAEQVITKKLRKTNQELDGTVKRLEAALEDKENAGAVQTELRFKRECELASMQKKFQELSELADQKAAEAKKHFQQLLEGKDQDIEELTRANGDLERKAGQCKAEIEQLNIKLESEIKARGDTDKKKKALDAQLTELQYRTQETERLTADLQGQNVQLLEAAEALTSKYDEKDSECTQAKRELKALQLRMEELSNMFDDETQQKLALQARLKSTEQEMDEMREQLIERDTEKATTDYSTSILKAQIDELKSKLTSELGAVEESERAKKKLLNEISDLNNQLAESEAAKAKAVSTSNRLQADMDDLTNGVNTMRNEVQTAVKRMKKAEALAAEQRSAVEQADAERQTAQSEASKLASEVYRLRGLVEEHEVTTVQLRKENQNLKFEIDELQGSSDRDASYVANLEKAKRSLEGNVEELKAELEEIEDDLQTSEDSRVRLEVAMQALRQQSERELAEKEEKGEESRRGLQRHLRDLEEQLEDERQSKASLLGKLKKNETDFGETQALLDESDRQKDEISRQCKKMQQMARDSQTAVDEAHAQVSEMQGHMREIEKKWSKARAECVHLAAELERSERNRKALELKNNETAVEIESCRTQISSLEENKRRLESELAVLNEEKEDMLADVEEATDRERKAQLEIDGLRHSEALDKDLVCRLETQVLQLDTQCKDLRDQATMAATNYEKRLKSKLAPLEQKAATLLADLDMETKRSSELSSRLKRMDRKYREAQRLLDDVEKSASDHRANCDRLQLKARTLSHQNEELENDVSSLRNKNRRLQADLNEATERVELLASQLQSANTRARKTNRFRRSKLEGEEEENEDAD